MKSLRVRVQRRSGLCRAPLVTGWVVLFCASVVCGQVSMTPEERSRLFDKISYATTESFASGMVSGRLVRRQEGEHLASDVLEKKVKDFETNLRARISRGEIELSDDLKAELQSNYGTTDYARLLNNPRVSNYMEHAVTSNVTSFRKVLENGSGGSQTESDVVYRFDQRRLSARVDHEYGDRMVGGQRDSHWSGSAATTVVDPQSHKTYEKRAGAENGNGYVREGSGTNQLNYYQSLGLKPVNAAGLPVVRGIWNPEEMKSVTQVDTPEGPALKILFEAQRRDRCDVIWVLPEKGYRLFREERYGSGNLQKVHQYEQYKEVQPGMWYPMHQRLEKCRASLAPEVREKLNAGQLTWGADEVLASQVKGPSLVEELWINDVQPNLILDDSVFRLDFPLGTRVQDFVIAKSQDQPFQYVVGIEQTYQNDLDARAEEPAAQPSDANAAAPATKDPPRHGAPDLVTGECNDVSGVQESGSMAARASNGWLLLVVAVPAVALLAMRALRQRSRE